MKSKKKIIIISGLILTLAVAIIVLVFVLMNNENRITAVRETVEDTVTTTERVVLVFTDEDILETTRETITYEFTDENGARNLYEALSRMLSEEQEISRRGRRVTLTGERTPIREATREEMIEFYERMGFDVRER